MPATPQPWFKTGLRFCGSCLVTLACWTVWLALAGSLSVLIYIAVAKELTVPDFMLRHAEGELAKAGLTLRFGRARFDPTGKILFEDVSFRTGGFEDPLLTCRLLYLRRDFWSILAGRPVPDEIRLEGAAVQLPAMLSPSGTTEPLLRDVALTLRHDDQRWLLDQFNGRIGPLVVTASGEVTPPSRVTGGPALSAEEIVRRFLGISRRVAVELHRLDAFEAPMLAIELESPPGVGNTAHLLFTARGADSPGGQPLTLGPLVASGTLRLNGAGPRPLRLHAATTRASFQETYLAAPVRAILTADVQPEIFSVRPRELDVTSGGLSAPGVSAVGPVLHADLARWPEISLAVATQLSGEFLAAEVDARLQEQSARIRAEGRGDPGFISRVLTEITPRAAPYFVFGDPVNFRAEAELGPGWKFARLRSRVDAGRLDSHGVKITAARGRIDIEGMSFLAHDARVELADNSARGSYWMDFTTTDYRMLLEGRLRPPAINGWFRGDWWLNFWNAHFDFPTPPSANVDVSGRWRDPARTAYFGSTDAGQAEVWGGDFERTHARIFLRPGFTHALELNAVRAGGAQRLAGTFLRTEQAGVKDSGRLQFDFESTVEPAVIDRMLDGKAAPVLASLAFTAPPQVHATGVLASTPDYTFTGRAAVPLHYYGFPLESAEVRGGVTGNDIRLDDIRFVAAGGKGSGKASLSGPADFRRLGFDVYVNGAELARAIRAVEEYQANLTGEKPVAAADSKFMKRAASGRLDVSLSALGDPASLASFTGTGNASLTGTELGEIHLFGLLSQVLSGLSLNFSSLKLDAARTSFRLDGGRLLFPDLKITGSSAVIDARGNFNIATKALDFTARFKPYEDNLNLLTATIGIVINPITRMLELKLTGPISKPAWSIVVGGSSSHPEAPLPAPAANPPTPPAAPAADSSKPLPPKP